MMQGYKETKIGWLPDNWEVKTLGELGSVVSGLTYSPTDVLDNGLLVLRSSNVNKDYILLNDNVYVSHSLNYNPTESGDVLICVRNGSKNLIGKTARINKMVENVAFGAFMAIYRSKLNDFIYNYFKSDYFFKEVHQNLGATINSINNNDLKKFKIPLPPLEEQKAIADCLSTWDKAIELQRDFISSKEARKKALAQQLLTGKRRLPGFTGEWKEEPYGKLLSQVKRKENWEDNHLYHLISVRRRSGGIFHRDSLYGHQIAVKELMKVKKGDFLISKMQILHGASSIVKQEFENFYVSGSYIILNVRDPKKLSPDYLDFYSKQKIFYHQTYISSYGVHIEKMTFDFKTFLKMNMMIPSIEEQNAIVKVLETADKELQLEKQKLANLQQQKKALMQQLLTGKVRLV